MRYVPTKRRTSMKLIHLAAIAILSSTIANHVLAQEVIKKPRVQPKESRGRNLGIGSSESSERFIGTVENSTVWLAPVGHRQPRAADIPKSAPEPEDSAILDRENAFVDSKIGICRGC
jgi:hypothetical protein